MPWEAISKKTGQVVARGNGKWRTQWDAAKAISNDPRYHDDPGFEMRFVESLPKDLLTWTAESGLGSRHYAITEDGVVWRDAETAAVGRSAAKGLAAIASITSILSLGKSGSTLTIPSVGEGRDFVPWSQLSNITANEAKRIIYLHGNKTTPTFSGNCVLMELHCTPEAYEPALQLISKQTERKAI